MVPKSLIFITLFVIGCLPIDPFQVLMVLQKLLVRKFSETIITLKHLYLKINHAERSDLTYLHSSNLENLLLLGLNQSTPRIGYMSHNAHSSKGGLKPPVFRAPPPFQFSIPFLKYHRGTRGTDEPFSF